MTISDEDLRRALEARLLAARSTDDSSLAALAATIAIAGPRPAPTRWGFGMRWIAIAAAAILIAAIAFAVVPGTRPAPAATEPPVASAVQATAVAPSPTDPPEPTSTPTPTQASLVIDGCADLGFDALRCPAVVAMAATQLVPPVALDAVTRATLSPPGPDQLLGTFPIADIVLLLEDGTERRGRVRCGGQVPSASDRACNGDARLGVAGGIDHDVPCTGPGGEPGTTCATPVPTPRPASVAAARPLRIATLDIPIDHVGHYEIPVGDAGLPDGALTERSATLADPRPTTFWLDSWIWLDVRPDDPRRPMVGSVYRKPYKGVETVHVWLVFDVTEADPGATFQVQDLVVR